MESGSTLLGALIAAERQRRGLTRRELAELIRRAGRRERLGLGVSEETVKGWEVRGHVPRPAAMRALAAVLELPVEVLTALARPAGNLMEEEDEDLRRRAFLAMLAATGSGMVDLERLAAPVVDGLYLRDAEILTNSLLGQWYAATPSLLLPPAFAHLKGLQRGLPGPPALENLTGRIALLVGYLFSKLKVPGEARTYYALADALARDTGDTHLQAVTLVAQSGLVYWRHSTDTRRSRALIDEAAALVGPGAPGLLRTAVLSRRAEERAAVGDEAGCLRDLEVAEAALRAGEDHWYGPRDAAELAAMRGASELLLGRHPEAAETLAWTLERMDSSAVNWRRVVAADRERALAGR